MNTEGNRGSGVVTVPVRTRYLDELMAAFDAMPPAYRRLAREAAYNIDVAGLTTCSLPALRQALEQVQRASVLATYGEDHPQARKP